MSEFATAVERETTAPETTPFTLYRTDEDGNKVVDRECQARYPKDGQVAMFFARAGKHSSLGEKTAGLIDFLMGILDDDDHQYVVERLMDWEDDFGVEDISKAIQDLMEEWGGRPTK